MGKTEELLKEMRENTPSEIESAKALLEKLKSQPRIGLPDRNRISALERQIKEKQEDRPTVRPSDRPTIKPSVRPSDQQTDNQSDHLTDHETDQHDINETQVHIKKHEALKDQFLWMTNQQARVYSCLVSNEGNPISRDILAAASSVPYGTVRGSLRRLVEEKLVFNIKKYRRGTVQGFTFELDQESKKKFIIHKLYSGEKKENQPNGRDSQTIWQTDSQTIPYNNNSFFIYNNIITPQIFEHAEMSFWKDQGITSEMIQKNIEGSGISEELFVQYMKHYAFKAERGDFKDKEINSHFEYFIGGLKRFSGWTRPNGYISHEEAEKKRLEAFIAEKRKELEELEALKLEAEFLCFYESYIKTPDSEEVKAIMNQATSFDLDNLRRKPDKKETWLRTIWNKSRNMN